MITRYHHGRFYLMTDPNTWVSELWTEHGHIIHLGPSLDLKADRSVDLQGGIAFPGFVDAHLHLLGYGEKLSLLHLEKNPNAQAVLQQVRSRFKGKFLYVQGHLEQAITKKDLDAIASTVPILLRHADYHGATVNSALLRQIGLAHHPTGILHEAEAMKAVQAIPKYTRVELEALLKNALTQLYAFGVTGGHSDDLYYFNGFTETVAAFESVLMDFPFRTHLLIHHQELDAFLSSGRAWGNQSPWLQLGAIKTFYDGTLSSQTALMHAPYQHSENLGERQFSPPVWQALLKKVRAAGLPVAVHTIGDRALQEVAQSLKAFPVKKGLHDRIIHASFADRQTILNLKSLPLIFDIQPQFLSSDLPWGLNLIARSTEYIYPWKSYQEAGLILCGSSDAPVEIPNPLLGIHAAYTRQSHHDHQIYHPEQRLSIDEAVRLYTTGANAPTYDLAHRGRLAKGCLADLTVLDTDILLYPEKLLSTQVKMTIINDQIVYSTLKN